MSLSIIDKKQTGFHGPFKEYRMMSLEEAQAEQAKQDLLIDYVEQSVEIIREADKAVITVEDEKQEKEEWQSYISCDPLPRPYEPENIRNFFTRKAYVQQDLVDNSANWLLAVDERSILTQDIDAPNLTRSALCGTRLQFGDLYNELVMDAIEILRRIKQFLKKPNRQLPLRVMSDIEEMKYCTYVQIKQYIEDLTYHILRSEEAYMDDIDAISSQYMYKGKEFDIHLWAFKNVPLNLDPRSIPFQEVNLSQIETKLIVPFSALSENMVVRGLHCKYDHFSVRARFYQLPKHVTQSDTMETDLARALRNDMIAQTELQNEVIQILVKQRVDFEEALQMKEAEQKAKDAQLVRKGVMLKKKKKMTIEKEAKQPQIVEKNEYPDVRENVLAKEQQMYEDYLNSLRPIDLPPTEINLRKYQILGGTYQLNFITKPHAANFPKLIMTWYDSGQGNQLRDIKVELDPQDSENIAKFFRITFRIPDVFCHWGEPIPCFFHLGVHQIYKEHNAEHLIGLKPRNFNVQTPVIINDFNLNELFTKPLLYKFVENVTPRLISSFRFPTEIHSEDDSRKGKAILFHNLPATAHINLELEMKKHLLSFQDQAGPERLFPLFEKVLPIIITPNEKLSNQDYRTGSDNPYKYFSQLIAEVDKIKDLYRTSTFLDAFGRPVNVSSKEYEKHLSDPSRLTYKRSTVASFGNRKSTRERVTKKSTLTSSSVSSTTSKRSRTEIKKRHQRSRFGTEIVENIENITTYSDEDEDQAPSKWSISNILKTEYNPKAKTVTIWTDRLGTFGLAFYRYQHFPFVNWLMNPVTDNREEVELIIESMYALFRFRITPEGYKVCVSDFSKAAKTRKIYLNIKEPIIDIQILKEKMQELSLNVFPEHDYALYMTGYFSEKHIAAEFHTYNCMSLYATSLKFLASIWNKLSKRRIMVLKFGEPVDLEDDLFQIQITPEYVKFVDIVEVCTDDLDNLELAYKPTWRNFEWYPDLNKLIVSTYNAAPEMRIKNLRTLYFLKTLLQAVRPLSCS